MPRVCSGRGGYGGDWGGQQGYDQQGGYGGQY